MRLHSAHSHGTSVRVPVRAASCTASQDGFGRCIQNSHSCLCSAAVHANNDASLFWRRHLSTRFYSGATPRCSAVFAIYKSIDRICRQVNEFQATQYSWGSLEEWSQVTRWVIESSSQFNSCPGWPWGFGTWVSSKPYAWTKKGTHRSASLCTSSSKNS